jgi:hypothetical protein
MNHILPRAFFQWCLKTSLAQAVSHSMWGFAVLETVHIIGLVLVLGSILVINLRMLGFGVKQPVASLTRDVAPWGLAGFLLMLGSGIPMFMSAAVTYSGSLPFLIKMILLLSGIALQIAIYRVSMRREGSISGRLAACFSLICWFGVAYAGRAIAFEILFSSGA